MVRMFIRHNIADYGAWREGYDAFDAMRSSMGVTANAVYQSVDDPNDVTVTHDFEDADAARAFTSSPELRGAMENAGVTSEPMIWVTNAS
jgi:quinol monooxygenase YgiN